MLNDPSDSHPLRRRDSRDGARLLDDRTSAQEASRRTIANFTDLEGGKGLEVYFRPVRRSRAELEPLELVVVVCLVDGERTCRLRDLSQNGVAHMSPTWSLPIRRAG